MRLLARTAFFVSGIAGLTFEIVWLRYLGLTVGATTLAVATTTAAYMGGLALGSHLGGKLSDRLARPLVAYGILELAVATFGALVPAVCRFVPVLDERLLADLQSGLGRALIRFVAATAVLLLPTTAMGMTLPILARAVTDQLGKVGREVGTLYALNLAGAVVGAALTGFVLMPNLGLSASNRAAVGIDLGLALVAIVGGLMLRPVRPLPTAASGEAAPLLQPGSRLLVGMLSVTGLAAMALQVLWTRALSTALGPSTYAFSAIVCAYLIGLAIGGAIASRLVDRIIALRFTLATVLIATSLAAMAGIAIVDDLPVLLHPIVLNRALTMGGLVRTEFVLAALVVLPAAAGMGAIFPLTLSAVVGSEARLGAAVGRAYAINTLGNIAGSFAGVFILLYFLGVERGMRVAALAYVACAAVLLWKVEPSVPRWSRRAAAGAAVLAGALLLFWPTWDVARWTVGLYRLSMTRSYFTDPDALETSRIIFHKDGLASTVTVEEESGTRWIKVNGKIDGSSQGDMPTQVLSGILPMLLHPAPKEIAIIGCGSCVTVGAALRANPDHVTLIELEPEVVRASHLFAEVNHEPWNDPRLAIVEDDGRNFMRRAGANFDVIISEPSNPWMTGAASLFTLEFFTVAKHRLNHDGIFLQWLQAYELAPERIASALRTFNAAFPHMLVFSAHPDSNDLLLVGSTNPVRLDRVRLTEKFPDLQAELARAEVKQVDDLLALLLLSDVELAQLPVVPLNTDDNALIEFGAPTDLVAFAESDPELPLLDEIAGHRVPIVQRLGGIGEDEETLLALTRGYLRRGMLRDAIAGADALLARRSASEATVRGATEARGIAGLLADEKDRESVVEESREGASPAYQQAVQAIQKGDSPGALKRFEEPPGGPPRDPRERLLYAYLLYLDGQYDAARRHWLALQGDAAIAPYRPAVAYYLSRASFQDGEYARAVSEMQRYRLLRAGTLSASRK
jgi:spermidine synthase